MADQGQSRGLTWQINNRPSYATLDVNLTPGGTLVGEGGSMICHSAGITAETKMFGGCIGALTKILSKESLFITTYAASQQGFVSLAPSLPGDIVHIPVTGQPTFLAGGAFLAHSDGVQIRTVFGGCRSLFGGSGLFVLEATGQGDVWGCGFGAISEMFVDGQLTIDTGHIIGWDAALTYTIQRVGGWKSTFLSGEGLVAEFTGRGRVLVASRNLAAFASWLMPWLPR